MVLLRPSPRRGPDLSLSWVTGLVSGILAAAAGAAPTGVRTVDFLLIAGVVAAVTIAAATAPWWALTAASGVAAVSASRPALVALALGAVVIAIVVGARQRSLPWARSLAALVAIQVFARLDTRALFGFTAAVACTTLGILFVLGVHRREANQRRRVWSFIAVVAAAATAALLGLAFAAMTARAPLEEANRQTNVGLDALNDGDMHTAANVFADAARSFADADHALSAIWAQPSRLLPVVAQHRESAAELTAAGAHAMAAAGQALQKIDPSSLQVVDGRIDLDAVRALVAPFGQLQTAIGDVSTALSEARSPWLVAPLQHKLATLGRDIARNKIKVDNASLAVQVAPDMLGGSGPRRYFVAFTTPAEARGLGGFMGNWAEITIDDGVVALTRFGRTGDLTSGGADPAGRRLTGLGEFLPFWGRFGFSGAQGTTARDVWSNVTMAPDFPTVAQVIAQLYPQSGGEPIDGAFSLDPQGIAALMSFTGPVSVSGVDEPITADNAAQFIVSDQYELGNSVSRVDVLDQIASATVASLLTSTLPPPADLARTFGPLAEQGRVMAWSSHPPEQELLARVGLAGAFPKLDGRDGVAVVVDNQGANKIDAYLDVTLNYAATRQTTTSYTATLTVTLTNNAPASGLPDIVIGNPLDLPVGTNRMFLSIYTALPMRAATLDGQVTTLETAQVLGWNVASQLLDIAPGATRVVVLDLAGPLDAAQYSFVTRLQPLTHPAKTVATITDSSGLVHTSLTK